MRIAVAVLIGILSLVSCGDSRNEAEENTKPEILKPFNGFPNQQFERIELGGEVNETAKRLEESGYDKKSDKRFLNKEEQLEVILPVNEGNLLTFKVFMSDPSDIMEVKQLKTFFRDYAVEYSESEGFNYYLFDTKKKRFKSTLFIQDSYLRLTFDLIAEN